MWWCVCSRSLTPVALTPVASPPLAGTHRGLVADRVLLSRCGHTHQTVSVSAMCIVAAWGRPLMGRALDLRTLTHVHSLYFPTEHGATRRRVIRPTSFVSTIDVS